jgi:hypothetical protein
LLVDEAASLGIRRPNDFYGGVVPHPFVKTKAITHALVEETADRPQGWSTAFAESVRETVAIPCSAPAMPGSRRNGCCGAERSV